MSNDDKIRAMRAECVRHSVDVSRAKVVVTRTEDKHGNPVVYYDAEHDAPRVPIDSHPNPPSTADRLSPKTAEYLMLYKAYHIQVAERLKVRVGRIRGWDMYQIRTTPLTEEELTTYKEEVKQRKAEAKDMRERSEARMQAKNAQSTAEVLTELDLLYGNVEVKK